MKRILFSLMLVLLSTLAQAGTFGIHTVSQHLDGDKDYSNVNPGVYYIADSGLTAGYVRNSFKRNSVYLGQAFTHDRYSLLVGGITGYKEERIAKECPRAGYVGCYTVSGDSKYNIKPLLVPSVVSDKWQGIAARLSYIPKMGKHGAHLFTLSLEY